jgi:xanthine/uracil permease
MPSMTREKTSSETRPTATPKDLVYGIDDRPPWREVVPLGIQHVVAMLLGNITIPLLAAGALGLATDQTALLIRMVLVMAGLATIFHRSVRLSRRNLVILAVAPGLGLGIEARPEIVASLPRWAETFFGSGLIIGGLSGLLLNLALPDRDES